jgi:Skp family chaperone for outer membrane proteins
VKKLMVILSVVGGMCAAGYLAGNAAGQNKSTAPQPAVIGVVDLEHVFKNYEKFKVQTERVQEEFKQKRDELAAMDEQIKRLAEEQKQFKPTSPEYQQRDNEITQRSADLRAQAEQAQKEFARKDAALLRRIYGDIQEMIRLTATHKNLTLVLQTQSSSDDSASSIGEIRRDLSRLVLHHDKTLDITEFVLYNLNNRYNQQVSGKPTQQRRR